MKYQLSPDVIALNEDVLGGETKVDVRAEHGGYRSKLEQKAAETIIPLTFEWFKYEPFILNFPGGTYKPDFFGLMRGWKNLAVVEVKGWNKNLRADRLKFRAAAEYHQDWLSFCWLTHNKDGSWEEDWYKPKWLMNQ